MLLLTDRFPSLLPLEIENKEQLLLQDALVINNSMNMLKFVVFKRDTTPIIVHDTRWLI